VIQIPIPYIVCKMHFVPNWSKDLVVLLHDSGCPRLTGELYCCDDYDFRKQDVFAVMSCSSVKSTCELCEPLFLC
jgi:hypothetical protein